MAPVAGRVAILCAALCGVSGESLTPVSVTDNGAHGGEPDGTCKADEMTNAAAFLNGGDTHLRVASGSSKSYVFVYDLGSEHWLEEAILEGRSPASGAKTHSSAARTATMTMASPSPSHSMAWPSARTTTGSTPPMRAVASMMVVAEASGRGTPS